MAGEYLQYHFDGEGKQKSTKNEKERILFIWAAVQQSSLECREIPLLSKVLATCGAPAEQ